MEFKPLMKSKKGQLGLGTVKSVMLAFLILAVIGVAIILVLPLIAEETEKIDKKTVNFENESTVTVVNDTTGQAAYILDGVQNLKDCSATITRAYNSTGVADGATNPDISAANYTIVECTIAFAGSAGDVVHYNNTVPWNVTGSYTYSGSDASFISGNVSAGTRDFFTSTGTIFAILIVVVIILAIAIIIAVVSRFGGGSAGSSGSVGNGSKKEFGSDTVMGI